MLDAVERLSPIDRISHLHKLIQNYSLHPQTQNEELELSMYSSAINTCF